MKAITHKRLANYLVNQFMTKCSSMHKKAFILGCVQPDKNPATYVKGSFKQKMLHGHNWSNAKFYIKKLCAYLENRRRYSTLDYYKLGKLIHYTSDAFTYPHNHHYKGSLSAHRSYEQTLDIHAAAAIDRTVSCNQDCNGSLFTHIQIQHRKYLQEKSCPSNDVKFIILITEQIIMNLCNAK